MRVASFGAAAALLSLLASPAAAAEARHWAYSGAEGPEHWGTLGQEFAACASGKNQSPIDLTGFIQATLPPITFAYDAGATAIWNTGHTIQADYGPGNSITVSGRTFALKQVHFHAPSENRIDGRSFPLEAHLVHADASGNLAVVAVMFEDGAAHAALGRLWAQMPERSGDRNALTAKVVASDLLPNRRDYYRYNGSLTTPPCSEGVTWLVLKDAVPASKEQVHAFTRVIQHPNNRPLQPANARPVLK